MKQHEALTLLAAICTCASIQARAQEPLFTPATPVRVGPGSGKLALLDVNGDGHVDLIATHLLSQRVSICLGDGQGHFAPGRKPAVELNYQPGIVALGDLNNDRIPDMVIASRDDTGEYVHLLLGDGRGDYKEVPSSPFRASVPVATYKPALFLADLNNDDRMDVVAANGRRNTVEILLGDGRGGFSPGPRVLLPAGYDYYSITVGDIDGDGAEDLVSASSGLPSDDRPGQVETRRGNGKGAFADPRGPAVSVMRGPRIAALADLNGDGKPEIVINHPDTNVLSVLRNDGKGAFSARPQSPSIVGMRPFAVAVADANSDRHMDLVVATVNNSGQPFSSQVVVLLGDGQAFAPAPGSPFPAGAGAYNVTAGDVNEDGRPDLVASSFEGSAITLLLAR